MGWNGRYSVGTRGRWLTKPEKYVSYQHLAMLVVRNETMKRIGEKCLKHADDSEFQVHYHSVTVEFKSGVNKFYLVLPTVFYTFEQTVSSSHIDYHFNDVVKAMNDTMDIHTKVMEHMYKSVNGIAEKICKLVPEFESFRIMAVNDNSMHRHPGRFGFSSTDYDRDPEEPGVVFRKRKAEDYPQMDSVMVFDYESTVYTSEMRIITVDSAKDGGIEGEYVEIPTITAINEEEPNGMEALFGRKKGEDTRIIHSELCRIEYEKMEEIAQIVWDQFEEDEIEAGVLREITETIYPQIKKKIYTYQNRGHGATTTALPGWHANQTADGKEDLKETKRLQVKYKMTDKDIETMDLWGYDTTAEADFQEFLQDKEVYDMYQEI